MELRPRRGRSVQPPSTPTVVKPSPRPCTQSSSRKKTPPVLSAPILIPSSDEDADLKKIDSDPVDAAPNSVAAAPVENGDPVKQGNRDIILSDSPEFETPLSSVVKLRSAQKNLASSNVKSKTKVTSSVKKKKTVEASVADTRLEREGEACIVHDRVTVVLREIGLDVAPNGEEALQEMEKQDVFMGSVPQNSSELAVETTETEVFWKKTEVLSPHRKGKKLHSSKKKSVKKRHEDSEVVNAKPDWVDAQVHDFMVSGEVGLDVAPNGEEALQETEKQEVFMGSVHQNSSELAVEITETGVSSKEMEVLSACRKGEKLDSIKKKSVKKRHKGSEAVDSKTDWVDVQVHDVNVDALIVSASQALPLVLSDDEPVQVVNDTQAEECVGTFSAREEAALEKQLLVTEVSMASSMGKKSRPNKKGFMKEDNLSQSLIEKTNDLTTPSTDTKDEDQIRHGLGLTVNSIKESKSNNFQSPSRSSRENEVAHLLIFDSNGVEEGDIVNAGVHEVPVESSDEEVSIEDERDKDIADDHDKLNATTPNSQKNVEECCSSDDDSGNASCGRDDDDEDEMTSVFLSSMKVHLQGICGPSELSTQKGTQAKQKALGRTDSQLTKSMAREPCSNGRLTGHGLLWCPEVVLSKTSKPCAGKPVSIVEANPGTIWGRDRCLQDGLCLPPVDPLKLNKLARKQKDNTAGAKWFNLSAPTITPELKKELQLLKLRGALDPKRHYKAEDSKGLPKFFQVGTVIGGPADFYSGRLTKKEQKSSLASELLSDSSLTSYRKRKYMEIQEQKQAGGKGFWKKKKDKRTPAWAKM